MVAWYNPDEKMISLMIFHLTERPNSISKRSPYTTWGYMTHAVSEMYKIEEAAEVVSLYLQDMEKENCWWEQKG